MTEPAVDDVPSVDAARREMLDRFLKHAKLSGKDAQAKFDHIFQQTVGNYLTCPKQGGATTPDWKKDKDFRAFVFKWTERIAKNLADKGKQEPTGAELEAESVGVMQTVHDDICKRLPWCDDAVQSFAKRPVCDMFLSQYPPADQRPLGT